MNMIDNLRKNYEVHISRFSIYKPGLSPSPSPSEKKTKGIGLSLKSFATPPPPPTFKRSGWE